MTMDYTKFNTKTVNDTAATQYDVGLRDYMIAIYKHMAIALLITGIVALFTASSQAMMSIIFGSPLAFVVMLAPVGIAIYMSVRFMSMTAEQVRLLLYVFAGMMGLSLASIFMIYTGESIARTFFITASTFGAMSIYGYTTKTDLSKMGSFLMMGVLGIILASIVNMFMHSSGLDFIISIAGVLLFTGLAAYDTQRLKDVYFQIGGGDSEKVAIYGAMNLYMDFINLFLFLLRFVGQRRD